LDAGAIDVAELLAHLAQSIDEANCFGLPDVCPWSLEQAVSDDFFPEE
jgi:hypothetical protein